MTRNEYYEVQRPSLKTYTPLSWGVHDVPLTGDLGGLRQKSPALSLKSPRFPYDSPQPTSPPGGGSMPARPPPLPCLQLFIRAGLQEWLP